MRIKKKPIKKESKRTKYLYFIIIEFNGEKILKFGISNNYRRRFKEYNNSETIGRYVETLDLFLCDEPKKLETLLKWLMKSIDKPIFKYEYFDLRYYSYLISQLSKLSYQFKINLKKIE